MDSNTFLPLCIATEGLKFILVSSFQRILLQSCSGSFRCILKHSNQAFLLSVTRGLNLVLNHLYLHSRRCLFIVKLNNDTFTSLKVRSFWMDVAKKFYFTMEIICHHLLYCLHCILMLLSLKGGSFFLMLKIVDLASPDAVAITPIGLFLFSYQTASKCNFNAWKL